MMLAFWPPTLAGPPPRSSEGMPLHHAHCVLCLDHCAYSFCGAAGLSSALVRAWLP